MLAGAKGGGLMIPMPWLVALTSHPEIVLLAIVASLAGGLFLWCSLSLWFGMPLTLPPW